MALMFAFENLWPGVSAAVKSAVDPLQLKVAIYSSLSAYLLLLMIPEPISKLVVLGMTTLFIGYLGLDVFFSLLEGAITRQPTRISIKPSRQIPGWPSSWDSHHSRSENSPH